MKRKKLLLSFLCAFLLLSALCGSICSAGAQTDSENAVLILSGNATVTAQADLCNFTGCIETAGNSLRDAEHSNAELCKKLRELFAPYGTMEEECCCVYPSYGQTGFTAVRNLRFSTEQIDQLDLLREKLAEAGITRMEGFAYICRDEKAKKAEALRLAVQDAREKAAALGSVGELIKIEEISCYPTCRTPLAGERTVTFTACVRALFARRPQAKAAPSMPETQGQSEADRAISPAQPQQSA